MRQIKESTLVSLDGVIDNPPQWANPYMNDEFQKDALARLMAADALLMGRHTYEMFSKVFPDRTGDTADRVNSMQKYVFSSTMRRADWGNTTILSGDVVAEVRKLKDQDGGDLAIWGHGLLAQTLLQHGLIDELRVTIFPVVVGAGKLFFRENQGTTLRFLGTHTFSSGLVVVRYANGAT